MKGFVYLLEISIALLLIIAVLTTITNVRTGENWERNILVEAGDNILKILSKDDIVDILNGDISKIEGLVPKNMEYSLRIYGATKGNISVGCVQHCDYISEMLTPIFVNERWITFSVDQFDIISENQIPERYDAVVFVNYTGYSSRRENITNYIKQGGVVIALNATKSSTNADFNQIFDLRASSGSSSTLKFSAYDPSWDSAEKYFLGLGFDIVNDSYDTGNICLEGLIPGINGDEIASTYGDSNFYSSATDPTYTNCHSNPYGSFYVTSEFIPSSPGVIAVKTPYLPKEGDYTVLFDERRGTAGQVNNENFTVKCGGQVFFFPDDDDDGIQNWDWKSVVCHFNQGFNYINFSAVPNGMGIEFDTIRIAGSASGEGNLFLWETQRNVTIGEGFVDIENKTVDEGLLEGLRENDTFEMKGPDNNFYSFRVNQITPGRVSIQPLGTDFIFLDFSEGNIISNSRSIITNSQKSYAAMAANSSAVWISDFGKSDEYRTLLKAAIASRVSDYNIGNLDTGQRYVALSSFYPLCCDMAEVAKITIYLWYKI